MPKPPRASNAQRILVVASESVCADDLRQAVGDGAQDAEVLVVAPALQTSALRFWMSDADTAIKRASAVRHNSVRQLTADGVTTSGDTGEADPLIAIEDMLSTFDPDQIVVFRHADKDLAYREDGLLSDLQARFDVPVQTHIVTS
ncbi:MAG: hypothetical protein ACR2LK_03100 [Solirubrobacteraceae bacterium]